MKKIIPFSLFEGVENDVRLSEEIVKILNEQIKKELMSSQIYRGMSCYLDNAGWVDAAKYFFKAAQEELIHMDKIYQYIFDRNSVAVVPVTEEVKQKFETIREVVEESLKHEIEISKNWEEIAKAADNTDDNTTYEFAQWFLKEQIEEENKFRDILDKMNLDMPKYEIDKLFK